MSMPPDSMNKRYSESYSDQMNHINNQMNMMSTTQLGYNKLWVSDRHEYFKAFYIKLCIKYIL